MFEYDDTLPKSCIHPSPPVASVLFAYASANRVSGRDLVQVFLLGFETEARIGNAIYPAPESIAAVRVRVAPLVLDLCNKREITTGLEGKYSIYNSAAVGLTCGKAGLGEYTNAAANVKATAPV